jgi:hypothetical protein
LPEAHSLEQAFSLAQTSIAKREASEHTPSEPQAYFSADLKRVLLQHPMKKPAAANGYNAKIQNREIGRWPN